MREDGKVMRELENMSAPRPHESRIYFEAIRPRILTTFELPLSRALGEAGTVNPEQLVARMPFASFAVREPFDYIDTDGLCLRGVETVLLNLAWNGKVIVVSRIDYTMPLVHTIYWPNEQSREADVLLTIAKLYAALYGRKHRFAEKPISRQVRRAESRPAEYREYIVVGRDSLAYERASPPSEIARRLRALHVVRKHDRTYKHDRYINVQGMEQHFTFAELQQICVTCSHPRRAHLDKCYNDIYDEKATRCDCAGFVEPPLPSPTTVVLRARDAAYIIENLRALATDCEDGDILAEHAREIANTLRVLAKMLQEPA
jgi:hypothetical protein